MAFAQALARKLLPRSAVIVASVAFNFDGVGQFFQDAWLLVKAMAAEVAAFFVGLLPPLLPPLAKRIDELFPPETRSETLQRWVHVAVTVVLPAALGALALFCLARCCYRRCCARALARRMMVAPGRGGARLPRDVFEGNPMQYFRDLRARKPLVY